MYSSTDFERLFIRYKAEAVPGGVSMDKFCALHQVPYNLFLNWYKSPRHKVVPVQVTNRPEEKASSHEEVTNEAVQVSKESQADSQDPLLADGHPIRGELMEKALRYLKTFWTQLFNYLKNGDYTIDNSVAERCIRPLSGECKNSLFFGSDKMAVVSAAYHTVITTCRMLGISVLDYMKKFFKAIVMGRRDYENLPPQMIGIRTNNY